MRTVRDGDGNHYLLIKQSGESSLVREPDSGTEQYLPSNELEACEEESPLRTAAAGIDPAVRRLLTTTYDDQSLGLIIEIVDRGPVTPVELLETYELCESDLHGLLGEFRAAGLIEEADANGKRGYRPTTLATTAVRKLRETDSADRSPSANSSEPTE